MLLYVTGGVQSTAKEVSGMRGIMFGSLEVSEVRQLLGKFITGRASGCLFR